MVRGRLPIVNERPLTWGECDGRVRPCPFVTCRHHLLLDIGEDGRLLKAHDFDEQDADSIAEALREMDETCSLDVAARGGMTSRAVGELLGLCREEVQRCVSGIGEQLDRDDFDEHEHPDDPYLKYTNLGADELAEIAADLRARGAAKK
jgi:hypothetical protein